MLTFMDLVSFYNRPLNMQRGITRAVSAIAIYRHIMREMAGAIVGLVGNMNNALLTGCHRLFVERGLSARAASLSLLNDKRRGPRIMEHEVEGDRLVVYYTVTKIMLFNLEIYLRFGSRDRHSGLLLTTYE